MRHKSIVLAFRIDTDADIKSIVETNALEKIRNIYNKIPFENGMIEDIVINKISDEFQMLQTVFGLKFIYNIEATINIAYFEIGDLFTNIKLSKLGNGYENTLGITTKIPLYVRTQQEISMANIIIDLYQPNEEHGSYICSIATYPKFNNIILPESSQTKLKFDMKPFYLDIEEPKLSKKSILYLDPFGEETAKNRNILIQKSIIPLTKLSNISEFHIKEDAKISDIESLSSKKKLYNLYFISLEEVKKLKLENILIEGYNILLIYSPIIGLFNSTCEIVVIKEKHSRNYTQDCIDKFIFDVQEYINMKKNEASSIETLKPWDNQYLNSLYVGASENIKKLYL